MSYFSTPGFCIFVYYIFNGYSRGSPTSQNQESPREVFHLLHLLQSLLFIEDNRVGTPLGRF